jgi:hypothetical protein
MLRHQMGAALLFGLHNHPDAFIGLPSVIRDEVLIPLMEKHQAVGLEYTIVAVTCSLL